MIRKFISLATAIVTLDVYLQSQLHSNDPLFLFASNSLAVNSGMVLIAGLMVGVSFMPRFKAWQSYAGCAIAAAILIIIGLLGVFLSGLDYAFSNILLPLDYLFILEAGVVMSICALSYQHARIPYKLPAAREIVNKFAFPVPKIPHSPTHISRSRGRTQPA